MSKISKILVVRSMSYELRMCIFCIVRSYIRNLKDFELRYQVSEAKEFDDVVWRKAKDEYQLFHLKYNENDNPLKITRSQLFKEKNLLKYVQSFIKVNSTETFKNKIKMAVVYTNFDLDVEDDQIRGKRKLGANGVFKSVELDSGAIFDVSKTFPAAKYYKFDNVSQVADMFVNEGTMEQIKDALNHIIFAVRQPDDVQLKAIIKNEIKEFFKLSDVAVDAVFNSLEMTMRDWCDYKTPLTNQTDKNIINYRVIDTFFQQNIKNTSFNVEPPVKTFVGRKNERNMIKKILDKNQSLLITGLSGIGKTQLVRKFVEQYGQSDFYGKVLWIDAENNHSVVAAFQRLFDKLRLGPYERTKESSKVLFDYFAGLKVLFVFDNCNGKCQNSKF